MPPSPRLPTYCSTTEAARLLGVSVTLVQGMVESGQLRAWKTAGGHRRIERDSVLEQIVGRGGGAAARLRILAIDDDETFLRMLRAHVETWALPIDMETCTDGYESLLRIADRRPDLILLDLAMPGFDGFRVARALRGSPAWAGLSLVVISGLSADQVRRRGGLPEGTTVYAKPPDLRALRGFVQALLGRRGKALR